jgi:CHASE3 domain sensor protein
MNSKNLHGSLLNHFMRIYYERDAMDVRVSTEKKIFLGFGIAVSALAVSGFMAFRTAGSYLQSSEWVFHTQKVLRSLDTSWSLINEAESAQRAYLLTSSPFYYRERQESIRHLEKVVDEFPEKVMDNPLEERRALEIQQHVQIRLHILNTVLSTYKKHGLEAAQALLRAGAGIGEMTAIRDLVNEMHATEKNLLRERTEASRVAGEEALWVVAAAAMFLMILLGGLFWRIRAEMRDRLAAENALEESLLIEKVRGKSSLFSAVPLQSFPEHLKRSWIFWLRIIPFRYPPFIVMTSGRGCIFWKRTREPMISWRKVSIGEKGF